MSAASRARFPARCCRELPIPSDAGVAPPPVTPLCARGPERAVCGLVPAAKVAGISDTGATEAAPQPLEMHAVLWSLPPQQSLPGVAPMGADELLWLREHDQVLAVGSQDSRDFGGDLHRPVYTTDCSSLSATVALYDDGRGLDTGRNFGRHVRSLRRARGMTQEVLAERSGLSADTIRRLEHGSFSPSLDTLRKLVTGLDIMLSTLFESYELGTRNQARELADLLATRSPQELLLATRVLRALFDELDTRGPGDDSARDDG